MTDDDNNEHEERGNKPRRAGVGNEYIKIGIESFKVTIITCIIVAFILTGLTIRFKPYDYPWKEEICSQPRYLGIVDDSVGTCRASHGNFIKRVIVAYFIRFIYITMYIGGLIFIPTFIYKKINNKNKAH